MKWIYKNHFRTVIKSYVNKHTNIIVPLDKGFEQATLEFRKSIYPTCI